MKNFGVPKAMQQQLRRRASFFFVNNTGGSYQIFSGLLLVLTHDF